MTFAIPVAVVIAAIEAIKYSMSKRNGKSPTFQYTDMDRKMLERVDNSMTRAREDMIRSSAKHTAVLEEIRDLLRDRSA